MIHNELFNPLFSRTFKVGKDVEYLANISYENEKRKALEIFFKILLKNDERLPDVVKNTMYQYFMFTKHNTAYPKYENYHIYKDFYPDFINILNVYTSKLENDRSIYDKIVYDLYETNNDMYSYMTKLKENGIDLYPVYVKALKNMINDLKSRGEKLFMDIDYEKLKDMFVRLEEKMKSSEKFPIEILNMFIEFLKESKIYNVANFFAKYVFSVIPEYRNDDWHKNKENWFTKILANEFMNKLKKTGIEIDENILNLFSLKLITSIWDDEESYFDDKKRYENFKKVYTYQNLSSPVNRGFFNPETWKYFNPEFLKQFKDFDDFVENSGIKKDSEYFTSFFYVGMHFAYDADIMWELHGMDRIEFSNYLSNLIPIQKNHIKNYVEKKDIYLYRLNPKFVDKENKIAYYEKDNLINYFEVSNINSCIRNRLIVRERKDLLGISENVSFILLSDKKGNTIGRFIDVGDGIIVNLHYNGMAYNNAFNFGGYDIVSNYLKNVKKVKSDFDLQYQDITHNKPFGAEEIKNNVLSKMKDMKQIFHVNDYIKVNRKK